jgi:DNA-binding transcriptional MocR family regulator
VISLGSFSKILAPGLRLGWIQAGAQRLERLVHNGLLDSGGGLGPFTSSMVESALELGLQREHLLRLRRAYEERAAALCDALREHLPPGVELDVPGGGFFVWLRLPEGVDAQELLPIARRHDVAFQPGRAFSCTHGSQACVRLCFAYYDREQLAEGVRRLARALEALGC